MKTYSTKEAAALLGVSERAVQKKCKKLDIRKKSNRYLITDELINDWKESNDELNELNEPEEIVYEEFSKAEYDKLLEVIGDYPKLLESLQDHKHQIEYLKKSLDKTHEHMDVLLNSIQSSLQAIQQNNYLMAKKDLDKE